MLSTKSDELRLGPEKVLNAHNTDSGSQNEFKSVDQMCENMTFDVTGISEDTSEMTFDWVGIEPQFANTLRRLIIAEVPTLAIEKVFLYQNTSLVQDEVLSHRMGLIPLKIDPRLILDAEVAVSEPWKDDPESVPDANQNTTVVFQLHVKCTNNPSAPEGATRPTELYLNSNVYSKHLKWVPVGDQAQKFIHDPPRPVLDDILIAKMRPGQEIEMVCHCVRGIGREHAKFSPVATASYRLLPTIQITTPIKGSAVELFKNCFSNGVIGIVKNENGEEEAVVRNARLDMCSRNVMRHKKFMDCVVLGRKRNHFIFSIESTGAMRPVDIVSEACKAMNNKCDNILKLIDHY